MNELEEPAAAGEIGEPVSIVPWIGRHVLREARRGKRPLYGVDQDPGWRPVIQAYIASAFVSGFVLIRHRFECPAGRRLGREAQECEHQRFVWNCVACRCTCAMELTREGIRELALLERECREAGENRAREREGHVGQPEPAPTDERTTSP